MMDWDTAVYVSYFIIGGILTLGGLFAHDEALTSAS